MKIENPRETACYSSKVYNKYESIKGTCYNFFKKILSVGNYIDPEKKRPLHKTSIYSDPSFSRADERFMLKSKKKFYSKNYNSLPTDKGTSTFIYEGGNINEIKCSDKRPCILDMGITDSELTKKSEEEILEIIHAIIPKELYNHDSKCFSKKEFEKELRELITSFSKVDRKYGRLRERLGSEFTWLMYKNNLGACQLEKETVFIIKKHLLQQGFNSEHRIEIWLDIDAFINKDFSDENSRFATRGYNRRDAL